MTVSKRGLVPTIQPEADCGFCDVLINTKHYVYEILENFNNWMERYGQKYHKMTSDCFFPHL